MILLGYESYIRARFINGNKKSLLMYKIHQTPKIFLKWGIHIVLSNTHRSVHVFLNLQMSINATKWTFLVVVFACLFTTSFHSFSTASFASGINIAWSERSFTHTLGFPRQASRRDRCPELSEPYVTLGSLICTYYYCVHPFYLCVHPRLVEQNNIPSLYFFLPRFTLESISYSPGCRVTRRILSHRYAVSRDETTCAKFHLKNKITKWRPFFRSFHRSEFVYYDVMLHRIPSFYCNINTNEFCFRHFGSCYFGTTVSRTHVREHCLLHGIAASRFLILVSFFLKLLSQILVNASVHIWSGRDVVWNFSLISLRVGYTLSEEFHSIM